MDGEDTEKPAGTSHTAYSFGNICINNNIYLYELNLERVSRSSDFTIIPMQLVNSNKSNKPDYF